LLHPKGYTIINPGNDRVIKISNLIQILKSDDKNIIQLDEWSEVWNTESINKTKKKVTESKFGRLIKRIFGN